MGRYSMNLPVLGIIILLVSGCKTPHQVYQASDTVRTVTINNYSDTIRRVEIRTIYIEKIDSMRQEMRIKTELEEIKSGSNKHHRDSTNYQVKTTEDSLTPTLKKLDNKAKKDSIKGKVKLAKQVTQQTKAENRTAYLKLLIFLVFTILVGIIIIKVLDLFKK